MIRRVATVAIALCLSASWLFAQTTGAQNGEFSVKTASANVHKFPSIGSPVIDKVQRGTVLEITRNLGSWVEVPWPGGEGGVAFLHVNGGSIARSLTDPNRVMRTPAPAAPTPALAATPSGARAEQISAAVQPGARIPLPKYMLPSHTVGLGGLMSASSPGFGATARKWWSNRVGLQFEVSRYVFDSVEAPGHSTSFQFAPSVLYSLPDSANSSLWVRPYLGAGGSWYRTTSSGGAPGLASDKGLGFQAFGGGEVTFSAVPQFALSADMGYRRPTSVAGIQQRKLGFALSGHWYIK
jgi:hypothetical protein